MSEWAAKRFWKEATVVEQDDLFGVALDGRPLKTPAKSELRLPTRAMAERVADEWQCSDEVINPNVMPWTRSANSAVDKIVSQRSEVEAHLAGYCETDMLFYRADGPAALVTRQADVWDPLVMWATDAFGVTFNVTTGVMPVEQPGETIAQLSSVMAPMSPFELTGFHDLVTLSGSYLIGLAVVAERDSLEALWEASRLDEAFQIEEWGEDEEAREQATLRQLAFFHAADFYRSAKKTGSNNGLRA